MPSGFSASAFVDEDVSVAGSASFGGDLSAIASEGGAVNESLYPYLTNKFWVDIDGDSSAYFTELSGLSVETEVEYITEGGQNNYKKAIPVRTKWSNLTLKHGWGTNSNLWDWYFDNTAKGSPSPKNISVVVYSGMEAGSTVTTLSFYNAWPIKWKGSDLKASDGQNFAIEEVEIVYDYFEASSI